MYDNKVALDGSNYVADSTYFFLAGRYYLQAMKHGI